MNEKEKAAYFAQYWGQEVLMYDNSEGHKFWEKQIYPIDARNLECNLNIMHLILKPLSSITDEDAIEVAKLVNYNPDHSESVTVQAVRESMIEGFIGNAYAMPPVLIDYLRSKSYALPFRNYSVEQLIEMGWLTLTNN